ncbi:MAG: hypothetical protein WC774_00620 [Candidatus Gracilibacteria bacterium]
MPENTQPTLVHTQLIDQPLPSSPEVVEIMNIAHKGAIGELERFIATETNPVTCFLRGVNNTIASIVFNKEVNPTDFSNLIRQKAEYVKQLQEQEAANDAICKE